MFVPPPHEEGAGPDLFMGRRLQACTGTTATGSNSPAGLFDLGMKGKRVGPENGIAFPTDWGEGHLISIN